jgi:hypothetical protein
LDFLEDLSAYQRGVDLLVGDNPLLTGIPGQRGSMPERDILHINERFLFPLFVPDLISGEAYSWASL